jgi:hypothetical protein
MQDEEPQTHITHAQQRDMGETQLDRIFFGDKRAQEFKEFREW